MNAPVPPAQLTQAEALPTWRLDDLYASPDDPKIEVDFERARTAVAELVKLKGALVGARGNAERLGRVIDGAVTLYEEITNVIGALGAYAGLLASTARDDAAVAKFDADVRARSVAVSADTLFLTLELNALEEWEIEAALRAHDLAAKWRPWLRRVRLSRGHELAPDLERLIVDLSPAVASWSRLYDETLARLKVEVGKESLTLSEGLNRLSSPDPKVRSKVAKALSGALTEIAPVQALALNTLAFEKQVEDRWRKFAEPISSRHLANEVDKASVDALVEAVVESYPKTAHRYYALKARALGQKTLNYWDRNAPLTEAPARVYAWEEAKSTVLDAYRALAPGFARRAETFFDSPWIDAAPRAGKPSGAFSHPVTADKHPYVLMNFMGERRDVLTLAHELGHAVHQTLASPLGTLLADTPLTLAETASIFGEGLVFERLLDGTTGAKRRALLAGRIEDGLNTVVRQVAFHRFEERFHAERMQGELSVDQIGAVWMEIMGESLGPAVTLNEGYEPYWAYVSHFVHPPFYVYAYAFGDLLVSALMEKRREDPAAFAPLYEELLAAGGSKTYVEALAPFGLDPREKAFWAAGCTRLERLVDEFEALG
ncbi:M3 family oligoendopeptidase [soil metagenome]